MQSEPRLIDDMSFADYLSDPAPEPSVTSGILRELLNGTPRHVWERTPRLNSAAIPETKAAFDLGSAAHALFVGHGAALAVIAGRLVADECSEGREGCRVRRGAHADPRKGLRARRGDGGIRHAAVRSEC